MPDKLLLKSASAYFEYGVLGITVVILLIVVAVLAWHIIKNNKTDEIFAKAIKENVEQQKEFNLMYQESQKQHKAVIGILNETLGIERANTKECYVSVANKMDKMQMNQERIMELIRDKK